MKAEHRKELQTNALADRMGKLIQGMKTRPQRRTLLWVLGGLALALVVLYVIRYRSNRAREYSELWVELEDGAKPYIDKLADLSNVFGKGEGASERYGKTNQGKAARFQVAWFLCWDRGIKYLGVQPDLALETLMAAEKLYDILAEECKGDPFWEPEAWYHLAVIVETRAVENRENLIQARELYEKVVEKHKDSPQGKLAAQRAKLLEKDSPSYQEIAKFYADFQTYHRIGLRKLK